MSDTAEKALDVVKTMLLLNDTNSIHPSFLTKCIPELYVYLSRITNTYLTFRIQNFLEEKLNLSPVEKNVCSHPHLFLLMIEPHQLIWLKKTLGAVYCLQNIRKVIDKQKKKELLEYLGEETYSFVIRQGELYEPFISKINVHLPQEFSSQEVEAAGQFLLEYLWCRQPECLIQRFTLRFDSSVTWDFRHVVDCELQEQLLNLCRRLLRQEEKVGLC